MFGTIGPIEWAEAEKQCASDTIVANKHNILFSKLQRNPLSKLVRTLQ